MSDDVCCTGCLTSHLHLLLQETVEWLSRPENYDPDLAPPGLEGFDPVPFALSALPITASVMATQLAHELGHRVSAARKKVRCYAGGQGLPCIHNNKQYT